MEELKKFDNKHEIHVKLCLTLAKHGFKFLGTNDLGVVEGFCQECGHLIRYEQNYLDVQNGDEYTIGSSCMFKIYILSYWRNQIKEKDLENKHLQRAGKWLWIINRDGYTERIKDDIPQPKDYDEDFKKLADDLKNIVFKVRNEIKKEIAEKKRKELTKIKQKEREEYINGQAQRTQNWFVSNGIDINKCNDWEKDFLGTMREAYNKGWILSDKQTNIFNRIKNEKCITKDEDANQNLGSITIVDDISKKVDLSQLNDWEKEFMESVGRLVDSGYILSQKQLETLDKIDEKYSNDKKPDVENSYVGNRINSWLINRLSGIWIEGVIVSVKKESKSAILCDVLVEKDSEKVFLEEKWIPKSQLIDDNFNL